MVFMCDFMFVCYLFFYIYLWATWFYLLPMAIISVAYISLQKPIDGLVKRCTFYQNIFNRSIWAFVTEGLPSILATNKIDFLPLLSVSFILAITIPFDIRDLHWPHVWKQYRRWLVKAKMVSFLFMAELILFYRCVFLNHVDLWSLLAVYITYEISTFLVHKSHPKQKERFVTVGVEGMSILMGLMYLVFNY